MDLGGLRLATRPSIPGRSRSRGPSAKAIYGGATLANTGTIADASTDPANGYLSTAGTLDNRAGGVFDLQGDTNIYGGTIFFGNPGTGVFKNAGTIRKSAGSGTSTINGAVGFDNLGGTIDVRTGTLALATEQSSRSSSLSTGGTFNVAAGSVLDLTSDQHPTYTGTYTGSGAGTVGSGRTATSTRGSGATFNFPPGCSSGPAASIEGSLTNIGTITLSGDPGTYYPRDPHQYRDVRQYQHRHRRFVRLQYRWRPG